MTRRAAQLVLARKLGCGFARRRSDGTRQEHASQPCKSSDRGESIEVEDRDAASDSVRVRGKDDQRITIGTRAASKVLVHVTAAGIGN